MSASTPLPVNVEQLEAELRDCPHLVELQLGARAAFILTRLVQDARARGVLVGPDALSWTTAVLGYGELLFQDCPNAQNALINGWRGVEAAEGMRREGGE